jgi:Spy/CpxP family protein refolding chaperone
MVRHARGRGARLKRQSLGIGALVFLGTAATIGCGAGAARPPATAAEASPIEEEAAVGLLEHHSHHHYGGVALLVAMSLDTLGVAPDQHAAIETIRRDLHARMEPAYAAEQRLLTMLAEGVAANTLDRAKVDAAVAELASAGAAAYDASTDALDQLHAVLTPPQRAALVDKLEAHWSVWQRANSEDRITQLVAELGLSREQADEIRAGVARSEQNVPRFDAQEVTAHIRAFGDAFLGPTFDAKTLTTRTAANAHMVAWGGARMAHVIEAVSPVLTPEQRTNLSQMLREHATHNPSANGS